MQRIQEEKASLINPVYDIGAVDRPVGDAVSQSIEGDRQSRTRVVVAPGLIRIEEESGSLYIPQHGHQYGQGGHPVQPGARQHGMGQTNGNVEMMPRPTQVLTEIGEGRPFYFVKFNRVSVEGGEGWVLYKVDLNLIITLRGGL